MNKVIIVGNLARDPELSQTTGGISVCRMTVAVQRRFSSADGQREADFIPVVVWRNAAENCHKYLRKGSKVGVSGSIQTRNYEAQDGTKRYVTEIIADDVEFLSSKSSTDEGQSYEAAPAAKPARKPVTELEAIEEDDLPF